MQSYKTDADTVSSTTTSVGDSSAADDTFTLYDLRVEAVCPPGSRILCGAKEGDYFTLEGEMLYLPPGQGISIYSLGTYSRICQFVVTHAIAFTYITLLSSNTSV